VRLCTSINAILFPHLAPQPGHMEGEFWQMAEKRNAATAQLLSLYGIGGFGAMEAFKISN